MNIVLFKVPVIVRLETNSNFLDRFSKKTQISNFMKNMLSGAELLHNEENGRLTQSYEQAYNVSCKPSNK